ncbi:MAG TPA: plastocyanin/azurin family copper-binding protein, partial [Lysobacter sp.]|nr:plastocyanin/azurin family copper-binding protein [Lysobacter sp.]
MRDPKVFGNFERAVNGENRMSLRHSSKSNRLRAFAGVRAKKTMAMCSVLALGLLFSATTFATDHIVTALPDMTFSPNSLTITAGDTVTFKNGGGPHNVKSDPGAVTAFRCANGCDGAGGNGDVSNAAWSATVKFPTAGTIGYYCEPHGGPGGIGMSGKIIVKAATKASVRRYDFNGDGRSDILWRNGSNGANSIWRSASSATKQAVTSVINPAWSVVGSGDYNGDGRADILWRNGSTGANSMWLSASSAAKRAVTSVAISWKVVGSGDYNGDG